ncbi:ADP-ribosylglycohydrolase family protein [Hymenobacter sp. 15J16-1T3B]|uniref:ADP-ribosylglycohydrolase family protein n=1 Tax=Hymenobacter sp. 15J16-1T3B TaxID=2886941 RepID=UPI001D122F95|nr:ADP-ribosylglycohydrolase family protein [Hymenobacter sp. 15J16-1T3B]MCC3156810.1 ADP-ribosylglycohydrolase family protein [Hymenobacter sp. 15J16-1T3B]
MATYDRLAACLFAGAIGDAYGSSYEQAASARNDSRIYYPFGRPPEPRRRWRLTDDTQLTLATCEAIIECGGQARPEAIAATFRQHFEAGQLTGLGSSTLHALQGLVAGGHWSQVGRGGDYAAGNGAAMRIAPLAFLGPEPDRQLVEAVCRITHRHPEAYAGALAVVLGIRAGLADDWTDRASLLPCISAGLPDTRVRDRLLELQAQPAGLSIADVAARFGSGGYVVESVALALWAAAQVPRLGLAAVLAEVCAAGGDTDTTCSLAGQVAGARLGTAALPTALWQRLQRLPDYVRLQTVIARFAQHAR